MSPRSLLWRCEPKRRGPPTMMGENTQSPMRPPPWRSQSMLPLFDLCAGSLPSVALIPDLSCRDLGQEERKKGKISTLHLWYTSEKMPPQSCMYVLVCTYICNTCMCEKKNCILCGLMKALDLQAKRQGQDEGLDSGVLHWDLVAWWQMARGCKIRELIESFLVSLGGRSWEESSARREEESLKLAGLCLAKTGTKICTSKSFLKDESSLLFFSS